MGTSTVLLIVVPTLVALIGVYLNHTRLSRIFKENELIKVINSKNSDIDKLGVKYEALWSKFEKINDVVKDLNIALIRLNSINFTYPFPFMLKDREGKILMVNDEWARLNNIRREDAIGKTDYDIFADERGIHFKDSDNKTLNSPLGFVVEKDLENINAIVIKWQVQGVIKEEIYIAVISVPAQTLITQCQNKT